MELRFDGFLLDLENYSLSHRGECIQVEPQVFDLLVYLINNREKVVSRDELMSELWAGKVVSDATLSSCIKEARRVLGDDAKKQQYIATLHRRGYRFVFALDNAELKSVQAPERNIQHVEEGNPFRIEPNLKTDKTAIAILPFNCRSNSEEDFWLSDVLGEDLSIILANVPGFWVISYSTMQRYREQDTDIRRIGADLGVQYVIEGNLINISGSYRISLQLIEAANNQLLWADRHEFKDVELAEIQTAIAARIVASIEPAINRAELVNLERRRNVNLTAWQLYRQSHAILAQYGWSEESFQKSAQLLRAAIELDPDMAFAHAYLSLVLALGDVLGLILESNAMEEAEQAAEIAIRLDSQDSNVLGFVGCALVDLGKSERGMGLLRKAIQINPSNAQALAALGASLLKQGDIDGINWLRDGIRISPRDHRLAAWGTMLSRGLLFSGEIEQALEVARDSCHYDDKVYAPRVVLAIAHWHSGNIVEAQAAIEDAKRIRPHISLDDFKQFASPEELAGLMEARLI